MTPSTLFVLDQSALAGTLHAIFLSRSVSCGHAVCAVADVKG